MVADDGEASDAGRTAIRTEAEARQELCSYSPTRSSAQAPGACPPPAPRPSPPIGAASGTPPSTGDVHDFDFLAGDWQGANRQLTSRWIGSDSWDAFPASLRCERRLGGTVIITELDLPTKRISGNHGTHLRSRSPPVVRLLDHRKTGALAPPLVGGFTGDRGEFYDDDTDDGHPIKVQTTWTRLGPDTARWEQAYSLDGVRWETLIADYTRVKHTPDSRPCAPA